MLQHLADLVAVGVSSGTHSGVGVTLSGDITGGAVTASGALAATGITLGTHSGATVAIGGAITGGTITSAGA